MTLKDRLQSEFRTRDLPRDRWRELHAYLLVAIKRGLTLEQTRTSLQHYGYPKRYVDAAIAAMEGE